MKSPNKYTVADIEKLKWFQDLSLRIREDIVRVHQERDYLLPGKLEQIKQCEEDQHGLTKSLANPNLNLDVRSAIEREFQASIERKRELENEVHALKSLANVTEVKLDPQEIVDRLNKLSDLLAGDNATRTNIELMRHIEGIRCFSDGRVVVRSCKYGAFYVEKFENQIESPRSEDVANGSKRTPRPRRRSARRLDCEDAGPELREIADWATRLDRFAGLDDSWFWEDAFMIPEPTFRAKEIATEVASLRKQGWTHERLAEHFDVTVPTIRKSLKIAEQTDPSLKTLPRKIGRPRWQDSHWEEVMKMKASGMSTPQIAKHYDVSEPLVRWAIERGDALSAAAPASTQEKSKSDQCE
jgi:uncharacterized protein (DUF433 family)